MGGYSGMDLQSNGKQKRLLRGLPLGETQSVRPELLQSPPGGSVAETGIMFFELQPGRAEIVGRRKGIDGEHGIAAVHAILGDRDAHFWKWQLQGYQPAVVMLGRSIPDH